MRCTEELRVPAGLDSWRMTGFISRCQLSSTFVGCCSRCRLRLTFRSSCRLVHLRIVVHRTMNRPNPFFPQMCVKPRSRTFPACFPLFVPGFVRQSVRTRSGASCRDGAPDQTAKVLKRKLSKELGRTLRSDQEGRQVIEKYGGQCRTRTCDLLLVRQAL